MKTLQINNFELRPIKDLVTFEKCGNLSKSDIAEEGTPCILYGQLYTTYEEVANEIISKTDSKELVFTKKGDVLLPKSGETAEDISTSTCIPVDNVAIGGDLIVLRPHKDMIKGEYLSYILSNSRKKEIGRVAQGKSIVHISEDNISNITIPVISLQEQNDILNRLSKFDSMISTVDKELQTLKNTKSYFLQKMFPKTGEAIPEIRFNGFTENWEQKVLGDILDEFANKTIIENEYPLLSSTNACMEIRNGRVSGTSNIGYKIIENDDLVLSPQNLWLGNININNIGKGIVSPSYKTFKVKNVILDFYKPQIRTAYMMNEYSNASVQGASIVRRNLDTDRFKDIKIFVPSVDEQKKIGQFFNHLDNCISICQQKLKTLKNIKKGFLQQMFPDGKEEVIEDGETEG